ncbi:PIN domain-containing protein [Paenibacillus sp. GD4]|uniref:type II toxin-antitoxin system VapC family toxin n=1 Tax=Paenibacillus sp. GD4 TaxID=3068890 RepID=UPI002796AB5D|nr:PIN domain-containing protein [Paenibacillus sp. GD4]MDQ1908955.1 PIN domain-containing protein [Paenibacillus sp. GD4]
MSRGYLLDTNIAIAILINDEKVIEFAKQTSRDKTPIYFSTITVCEVFAGLRPEEQLRAEKLFSTKRCLEVSSEVARLAGSIRRDQNSKGRKLKTPDALIIATASVHELILVSRDTDMNFIQNELEISLIKI